tara:strand:+ start:275 stop:580 length:306 start_codon:yes stop_codon:yes gene_type:complete
MGKLLAFIGGAVCYEIVRGIAHRNPTFAAWLQSVDTWIEEAAIRASLAFRFTQVPVRSKWAYEESDSKEKRERHHAPQVVEDIDVIDIEDLDATRREDSDE